VGVGGVAGAEAEADSQPFVIVARLLPVWQPGILRQYRPPNNPTPRALTDGNKMI